VNIDITDIRIQENNRSGKIKAFVDIMLDGIIIRDLKILKEPGQREIVVNPQISWSSQGELRYKTLVKFPSEVKGLLDLAVLQAYHSALEKRNGRSA
jgi:DNA-binding cell septation regulator SpoVG